MTPGSALPGRNRRRGRGAGRATGGSSAQAFSDARRQIVSAPTSPLLLALLYIVVMIAAFVYTQAPIRLVETKLYVDVLVVLGVHGLPQVSRFDILVAPAHHAAFYAELTPSCSALSPALALVVLSMTLPKRNWPGTTIPTSRLRRPLAVAAAVGVVVLGNMIRIDSCLIVGLLAGSASLVLFHNWVGSIFGFAAVLGGYVLMLWIVLPDELTLQVLRRRALQSSPAVLHGDEVRPAQPRPHLPAVPPSEAGMQA